MPWKWSLNVCHGGCVVKRDLYNSIFYVITLCTFECFHGQTLEIISHWACSSLLSWMYCDVFCMLSPLDVFKDLASSAVDGYFKGDMWGLGLTLLVWLFGQGVGCLIRAELFCVEFACSPCGCISTGCSDFHYHLKYVQ